jgi:hypothetical protein
VTWSRSREDDPPPSQSIWQRLADSPTPHAIATTRTASSQSASLSLPDAPLHFNRHHYRYYHSIMASKALASILNGLDDDRLNSFDAYQDYTMLEDEEVIGALASLD